MPIPTSSLTSKRNKLTQAKRAREYFLAISRQVDALKDNLDKLYDVLGEAQNSPPYGIADGSISKETWTKFSEMTKVGREFCVLVNWFREEKV